MKLRAANIPTMAPVFQKPSRRISGALRHLVFSKGMAGTKCLMFRAGRYSVHQFIRSFSTFFTALVVLPRCLGKILWYLKPKNPIGLQWATAISASVKCTVMGVPSIIRSAWTSIKVSFYSIGAAIYHSVESVKSVFMFKILEAISHGIQALRSFVVGMYQSITIPLWHLTDYIGTVIESFRTGTIERFDRFKAKEQIWARNLLTYLDNGRNYVTGVVHYVLATISALFGKIWTAISSSIERFQTSSSNGGARVKESAYAVWEKVLNSAAGVGNVVKTVFLTVSNLFARAPGVVKEKAQYVVVRIHDTSTKAVTQVKIAMTDLLHMIQGVGEKLHEDEVHLKTVARDIHSKTHDLADGVKVGTVNIIKKVGQTGRVLKEQLELYFKAASGKLYAGKLFVKKRVAVSIEQLGAGLHHLRDQISETGRSARIIISSSVHKVHDVVGKAAGPIVAPFVYMCRLPRRVYQSFSAPSLTSYIFVPTVGVLAYMLYLKIECRYKRETYARQLAANPKVRNGCQEFHLSDSVLRQCMEKLRSQIDMGLNPATRDKSTVKCFNTYVQDLPTGKEKGQFLALDLGGTNFRVLLITLNGRHFDMQSKIYVVPQEIMTGDGEQLFDHIASCLESFALQHRVANKNLPLGFTFSFPLLQIGLKSGILQRWTKGFNCANTVGNDVVQMLQAALQKKNSVKIDVVAILNDTTGTLMSCAWKNHNCKVGVILGTGSNACYVEKTSNVIGFDGDESKPHVIINTEWGAFGDNGELEFIRTPFDKDIDKHSVNPGKQLFEKMVSGMYLGELARLLIVKFTKDKVLFGGQLSSKLEERWKFLTEYISEIESDPRGVFKQCRNVLGKMGVLDPTDQDCSNIRYICESVSRRAAHLASSGVATLINKMDIPSVTVGVDGSLYRYHPHFHNLMHEKIPELCNQSIEAFALMLSTDGSGRGAALVTAASQPSSNDKKT